MKRNSMWALLIAVFLTTVKINHAVDSSELKFDGIKYIDHNYIPESGTVGPAASQTDTASKLTNRLINNKANSEIFLIVGDWGSGKSADLAKIASDLKVANSLIVAVDLEANVPRIPSAGWKPEQMLDRVLGPDKLQEFQNQLRDGPSEINLFLDNVDRVSDAHARDLIIEYARNINERGGGVVITSTRMPEQSILRKMGSPTVRKIAPLSAQNIQTFLTEHWNLELLPEYSQKASIYAEAISQILEKAPIPRDFATIKSLGKVLLSENNALEGESKIFPRETFRSVSNYAMDPAQHTGSLLQFLDSMSLNKLELFRHLTSALKNSPATEKFYRSVARDSIFGSKFARPSDSAAAGYDLIYLDKGKFKFFRPEYEQYYAAQDLLNRLDSGDATVAQDIIKVLESRELVGVAEFLNADIAVNGGEKFSSTLDKLIGDPTGKFSRVLDNLIAHGVDSAAAAVTEKAKTSQISEYFGAASRLESVTKRQFGLIVADKGKTGSRMEMMLRKGMEKTIKTINGRVQPRDLSEIWSEEHVKTLLRDVVLTEPNPSIETYKYLANQLMEDTDVKFYEEMIGKTAERAGFQARDIIVDLIERVGSLTEEMKSNLLHDLVKSGDPQLLRHIVERFQIPVRDSTPGSLVNAALDAHPLVAHSKSQFWQMMHYVFGENTNWEIPKAEDVARTSGNVELTAAEKASPLYDLLIGTDHVTEMTEVARLRILQDHPLTSEFRPEVLSSRRKAILKDSWTKAQAHSLTLTETLFRIKGLNPLGGTEEKAFRETVGDVLEHEVMKKPTASEMKFLHRTIKQTLESAIERKLTSAEETTIRETVKNSVMSETAKKLTQTTVEPIHSVINEILESTDKLTPVEGEKVLWRVDAALKSKMMNKLTLSQLNRIGKSLSGSISTMSDFEGTKILLNDHMMPHLDGVSQRHLAFAVLERTLEITKSTKKPVTFKPTLEESLLKIPTKRYPKLGQIRETVSKRLSSIRSELQRIMHKGSLSEIQHKNPFSCVSTGSIGCHVNEIEMEELIKAREINGEALKHFEVDKFMEKLEFARENGDYLREKQLVEIAYDVVELQKVPVNGEKTSIFREVLEVGSLTDHTSYHGLVKDLATHLPDLQGSKGEVSHSSGSLSSKIAMGIFLIPMLESVYHLRVCFENNQTLCQAAYTSFGIGIAMFTVPIAVPKIATFIIEQQLASSIAKLAPGITKEANAMALRQANIVHLKNVLRAISIVINMFFIGYEVYTMRKLSKQLSECARGKCPDATRTALTISMHMAEIRTILIVVMLVLELLEIAVSSILGALAFVGFWAIEKLAIAFATTYYFNKDYNPNSYEYWTYFKMELFGSLITVKVDPHRLIYLQHVIDAANNVTESILNQDKSPYVAVAACTGYIPMSNVNANNFEIQREDCKIWMDEEDKRWSKSEARALPKSLPNIIQLGIPATDALSIDEQELGVVDNPEVRTVGTAVFFCNNAIINGHNDKWKKKTDDGMVYFYLKHAAQIDVRGHNDYHNHFHIFNGGFSSTIVGGRKSNTYDIHNLNNAYLYINTESMVETFNMGDAESDKLYLSIGLRGNGKKVEGMLSFNSEKPDVTLLWNNASAAFAKNDVVRQHRFLGRRDQADSISCADNGLLPKVSPYYYFYANGYGGSAEIFDFIMDCNAAAVHPYSNILSTHKEIVYKYLGSIRGIVETSLDNPTIKKTSKITLKSNASASLEFNGAPLSLSTHSIIYSPKKNSLLWNLQWTSKSTLELEIFGFVRTNEEKNYENNKEIAVTISDSFSTTRLGIHLPSLSLFDDNTDDFEIKNLDLTIFTNDTNLSEAMDTYNTIYSSQNRNFDVDVNIISDAKDRNVFYFGKMTGDRYIMGSNIIFYAGLNGVDIYELTDMSPEYIWINNEATDGLYDYLLIPDKLCSVTLQFETIADDLMSFAEITMDDLVIRCQTSVNAVRINVVLQYYHLSERYRHILIQRDNHDNFFILTDNMRKILDTSAIMIKYISLRDTNSSDVYYVYAEESPCVLDVGISDVSQVDFQAKIVDKYDVWLTLRDYRTSASLLLKNFYENRDQIIETSWHNFKFILTENFDNQLDYMELVASQIDELVLKDSESTEYKLEKFQKMDLIINRKDSDSYRLPSSALTIHGVRKTGTLSAKWSASDNAISICVKNKRCAVVKNWCASANYRLNSVTIEVPSGLPVTLTNLRFLECKGSPPDKNQDKLIRELTNHFEVADQLFNMSKTFGTSDYSRFKKCMAIFYMRKATTISMCKLMDFENMYEEMNYIRTQCRLPNVIAEKNFLKITHTDVLSLIDLGIKKYYLRRDLSTTNKWPQDDLAIGLLRKYQPGDEWYDLLSDTYRESHPTLPPINFKHLALIQAGNITMLPWYEKSIRFIQHCDSK